jgi:hypothetical protein
LLLMPATSSATSNPILYMPWGPSAVESF